MCVDFFLYNSLMSRKLYTFYYTRTPTTNNNREKKRFYFWCNFFFPKTKELKWCVAISLFPGFAPLYKGILETNLIAIHYRMSTHYTEMGGINLATTSYVGWFFYLSKRNVFYGGWLWWIASLKYLFPCTLFFLR